MAEWRGAYPHVVSSLLNPTNPDDTQLKEMTGNTAYNFHTPWIHGADYLDRCLGGLVLAQYSLE